MARIKSEESAAGSKKGFKKAEFGVYVKEEYEVEDYDPETREEAGPDGEVKLEEEEDVKPDIPPAPSLFKKKRKPTSQGNQPIKK